MTQLSSKSKESLAKSQCIKTVLTDNVHTNSSVPEQFNRTNYAGGQSANIVLRCQTTRVLLSTFLLIFFFMLASVGVMAQSPSNLNDLCVESGTNCGAGWTQGVNTLPFTFPGYPDCKIILIYAWRECIIDGKVVRQIMGQSIYTNFDPNDDCRALHDHITTGPNGEYMPEGNPAAIVAIFNHGFRFWADYWFDVAFKNDYNCKDEEFKFFVTYYRGKCVKYCTQTCIEDNIMTTTITELPCDGLACCKIERVYCYDAETGETKVEETLTPFAYNTDPTYYVPLCGYTLPIPQCPDIPHSCCIQKETDCHIVCDAEE